MISTECCNLRNRDTLYLRFLCHAVGFPFVTLERYRAPNYVIPKNEIMHVFSGNRGLEGGPVQSWL